MLTLKSIYLYLRHDSRSRLATLRATDALDGAKSVLAICAERDDHRRFWEDALNGFSQTDDEPDRGMHYACRMCGVVITAAEGDDNGGMCLDCAQDELDHEVEFPTYYDSQGREHAEF